MNRLPTRPTVGPRGGRAVMATPCSECVSWRSCRPGAISEPFGCEGWADQDGRRALPDELEADLDGAAEYERDRIEAEADMARLKAEPFLQNPEPEPVPYRPAAPFAPDQDRGEATAQACLPMADAGPLFAGCLEARR